MTIAIAPGGRRPQEPGTPRRFRIPTTPAGLAALVAGAVTAVPAQAHVKWFAPYIVDASPQPISATLTNVWFWTGIGLVLAFFLATLAVERTALGKAVLAGLDRVTAPLWSRSDDFMRVTTGAFLSRSSRSAAST